VPALEFARAFFDGAINVVLSACSGPRLRTDGTQSGGFMGQDRHRPILAAMEISFTEFREHLPAFRVSQSFFVLYGRPFTMTGHALSPYIPTNKCGKTIA